MRESALSAFHRPPEMLNCAQAVMRAYQESTGRTVGGPEEYAGLGGGRAPGGECGALHAACRAEPAWADRMRVDFAARAGSTRCAVLKRELRVPCRECVGIAADLLSSRIAP